jgi:hypothetical protein
MHLLCNRAAKLATIAVLLLRTATAGAGVTTDRGASALFFPSVIANPAEDTLIQLTNTSNFQTSVRCFYVNSGGCRMSGASCVQDTDCAPGDDCVPQCRVTDFIITLTAQQPTHWLASQGRPVNPTDTVTGLDPGMIPPVDSAFFAGELVCVQVDQSGAPFPGNGLTGEATRKGPGGPITYNPIGVRGLGGGNGDNTLSLDGTEFDACPTVWDFTHFADGALDPLIGTGSSVSTEMTFVPCTQNFVTPAPQSVALQFLVYNEFEEHFGALTTVTCWAAVRLDALGLTAATIGTTYVHTLVRPVGQGILAVGEELHHSSTPPISRFTALKPISHGIQPTADSIILPPFLGPGAMPRVTGERP